MGKPCQAGSWARKRPQQPLGRAVRAVERKQRMETTAGGVRGRRDLTHPGRTLRPGRVKAEAWGRGPKGAEAWGSKLSHPKEPGALP